MFGILIAFMTLSVTIPDISLKKYFFRFQLRCTAEYNVYFGSNEMIKTEKSLRFQLRRSWIGAKYAALKFQPGRPRLYSPNTTSFHNSLHN